MKKEHKIEGALWDLRNGDRSIIVNPISYTLKVCLKYYSSVESRAQNNKQHHEPLFFLKQFFFEPIKHRIVSSIKMHNNLKPHELWCKPHQQFHVPCNTSSQATLHTGNAQCNDCYTNTLLNWSTLKNQRNLFSFYIELAV